MLSDIKVLDLTTFLSGPFCTMILSDMGAGVLKIEAPPKGCATRQTPPFIKGESAYFLSLNRGKKSITLNLKSERGKKIFFQLVATSDVLVENFRPGVMDRRGFDYKTVLEINPRIVYASISGFGNSGPFREKGAYDMVIQGYGGIMSITGSPGGEPVRVGYSVSDLAAGLYGALAVTGALRVAGQAGPGAVSRRFDVRLPGGVHGKRHCPILRHGGYPRAARESAPLHRPVPGLQIPTGYFTLTASTDEQFRTSATPWGCRT